MALRKSAKRPTSDQCPSWVLAVVAAIVIGLPAVIPFALWMMLEVSPGNPDVTLWWTMWLAGVWLLIAPALIVVWDIARMQALTTLGERSESEGWNIQALTKVSDRWNGWPRVALPSLLALGMVVALLSGSAQIQALWGGQDPLVGVWSLVGLASVAWLGYTFGVGTWGVLLTLSVCHSALHVPRYMEDQSPSRGVKWDPFHPEQARGLEELTSWAYKTGLVFSCGAVFLPALYLVIPDLPFLGKIVGGVIALALTLGGLLSFLLPSMWASKLARRQVSAALARFTTTLNALMERTLHPDSENEAATDWPSLQARIEATISLHSSVAAQRATPVPLWWTSRVASVLLLPVAINAVLLPLN